MMTYAPRKKLVALFIGLLINGSVGAVTLQEAVQETLNSNPQVLASTHERFAVEQEMLRARAGYLPSIDLNAGVGRERSDNVSTGGSSVTLTRREAGISLTQMLFDGMLTRSEVQRHAARVNARAYSVFGTSEVVALRATEAYLDVLKGQELVKAAQANLAAHETTFDQIRLRSESGVGRSSDLDQAKGRLALATANLKAEEANLRDAESHYRRTVGATPMDLLAPETPAALPANLEEATQQALASHPTLKSAEADVESAHAQHTAAKAPFYPRVDLEIGATNNEDLDGVDGHNDDASAMIRMRYNLLRGGGDKARLQETAHQINQAKEIRNNTHREVVESIELSWNAFVTAGEQLALFEEHVQSSESARDAYRQQFNIGQRTLLDLLDSENEVFQARIAHIAGKYNEVFSRYRILAGTGKLLESMQVGLPSAAQPLSQR